MVVMMALWRGGAGEDTGQAEGRAVLKEPDFFLLRTAPRDHQPPTANSHQPPAATNRQPPPTTNHQAPTGTNHHQPPPTASCQLPTANRRQPPTANRQPPPTMVEHMECPQALLGKLCNRVFPLRTALAEGGRVRATEGDREGDREERSGVSRALGQGTCAVCRPRPFPTSEMGLGGGHGAIGCTRGRPLFSAILRSAHKQAPQMASWPLLNLWIH